VDLEDIVCAQDYRCLVPDGVFVAECVECQQGHYGRIPKLYLKFKLTERPYEGVELFMSFNMPFSGRIPVGSKYYKIWAKINGRLPSQNAKMSPRIFLNKLYKIKTRTVKPKDGGEELPEDFHYSIIDSIKLMF
jgi:hypothetical protein